MHLGNQGRSIKFKLIVLPLILVFTTISVIGASTAYLVRENLLDSKRKSGFELLHQIKARVRDNDNSLDNINEMLEEDMRIASEEIIKDRESINNDYLKKTEEFTGIDIIDWYNTEREVIYANNTADLGWIPADDHPLTLFAKSDEVEMM